jgi:hypothetical protein
MSPISIAKTLTAVSGTSWRDVGVFWRELVMMLAMSLAGHVMRSVIHSIKLVVAVGSVFQIAYATVQFIAVQMSDLRFVRRLRAKKGQGHKVVHEPSIYLPVDGQCQLDITTARIYAGSSDLAPINRPHSSFAGHLVGVRELGHRQPCLGHFEIVSEVA